MLMTMVNGGSVDQGEKRDTVEEGNLERKNCDQAEWLAIGRIAASSRMPSDWVPILQMTYPLLGSEENPGYIHHSHFSSFAGKAQKKIRDLFDPELVAKKIAEKKKEGKSIHPDDDLGNPRKWEVRITVELISKEQRDSEEEQVSGR